MPCAWLSQSEAGSEPGSEALSQAEVKVGEEFKARFRVSG